ncbi:MAG: oligosaccharide flippase family protein [Bacteroidota bacterium]
MTSTVDLPIGKKIARNTLFSIIGFAWQGITLLFLVPYIISRVGNEQYGIWALLVAVVTYFSLVDVGGNATLTKYVAEYYSKRDTESLAKLVNNGALFYLGVAAVILLLGLALSGPILTLVNIPLRLRDEAKVVFNFVLVIFSLTTFSNVFTSVISGLQRIDILNGVLIAANTLRVIGVVIVLEIGWSIRGIVISDTVVGICTLTLMIFFAKRLYPSLTVNPLAYNRQMLRRIVGFGAKLQVSNVSELINFQLDKILLSRFFGVQFVTFYDVGSRLLKNARGFPLMVLLSLVPAVSELSSNDNYEKLFVLYRTASKYLVAFGAFVFGFFFVAAANIVELWVGAGYGLSVATMRILCVGYFINLITGVVAYFSVGIGKPGYLVRVALIQSLCNIFLSLALIQVIGYYGAAIGTAASLSIGGLYFIGSFGKEVQDTLKNFFRMILFRPLVAALAAGGLTWLIDEGAVRFFLSPAGRTDYIPLLILNLLVFGSVYILLIKTLRHFEKEDWQMLRRALPPGLQRFVLE